MSRFDVEAQAELLRKILNPTEHHMILPYVEVTGTMLRIDAAYELTEAESELIATLTGEK